MVMTPLHVYATLAAVEESQMLGLTIRRDDWRDIFLAITETLGDHKSEMLWCRRVTGRYSVVYRGFLYMIEIAA